MKKEKILGIVPGKNREKISLDEIQKGSLQGLLVYGYSVDRRMIGRVIRQKGPIALFYGWEG